ncbi:MAG TPA: magnesium/cobalt transporter CorA, partial [Ignavibacteriaceae bacterium]|nr:magnesium/cobalt transporter CorA [Ignavibacteriaceae bacterium]
MLDNTGKKIKHQTKKQLRKVTRLFKNKPKNIGLAPGSLVYVGDKEKQPVTITLFSYKDEQFAEQKISQTDELFNYKESDTINWINIDGVHNIEILERFGKNFNIHPLTLEDILNTNQRPKVDEYPNYLYIVLRMFFLDERDKLLKNEQVSLILTKNYLITFLESPGDVFDPVRERIKKSNTLMRKSGTDYLAYALIDAIVDSYFHILEKLGEEVETLEDNIVLNPAKNDIQSIHLLRREMLLLRRAIWPLREVISSLQRNENEFFDQKIRVYLRDVYDHTIQVIDTIESYRDMIVGMLDTYLSSTSNKLNEVMKVLTVI